MRLVTIARRNLLRNKARTALTVLTAAVAVLAYVTLSSVLNSWGATAESSAVQRLGTRNRISWVAGVPRRYVDDLRALPDLSVVSYATWFGGKDVRHPFEAFASFAADSSTHWQVFDDAELSTAALDRWQHDPKGAVIGDVLARRLELREGDRVTLTSGNYPGDWEFTISAIYTARRPSADRTWFVFHSRYLEESLPPDRQGQVSFFMSRIRDSHKAAEVESKIDRLFASHGVRTVTVDEKAVNAMFLAVISPVVAALRGASFVLLGIMLLLVGNTMAMAGRERTQEHGVLRALGFGRGQILLLLMGEGLFMSLIGGLLGAVAAFPIANALCEWLDKNMGARLAFRSADPKLAITALALSLVIGALGALLPAYRASRVVVHEVLRTR